MYLFNTYSIKISRQKIPALGITRGLGLFMPR